MQIKTIIWFVLLMLAAVPLQADTWSATPEERLSPDGKYLLRVDGQFEAIKLTLMQKDANVTKEIWSILSPQELPPVNVYFSNDGKYVVLQDQWSRMGYGVVLAFIGPKGQVLKTYKLEDILTKSEILNTKLTVSSTWWITGARLYIRPNQQQFAFMTQHGTIKCFDLYTGELVPLAEDDKVSIREEVLLYARENLSNSDAGTREDCAILLGVLKDKESITSLKKLLDEDPRYWLIYTDEHEYKDFIVRQAAAQALVSILGDEAAPLVGAKALGAVKNGEYALHWANILENCNGPKTREAWQSLLDHEDVYVRAEATRNLSKTDSEGKIVNGSAKSPEDD